MTAPKGAKTRDKTTNWTAHNAALKACHRLGYAIWKQWSGYHRRSSVESKMHGFKRLGKRVMAHTFERQAVELHVRVARLNRFTQLRRPTTVPVAAMAWLRLGLGPPRCAFDLCSKAALICRGNTRTPMLPAETEANSPR